MATGADQSLPGSGVLNILAHRVHMSLIGIMASQAKFYLIGSGQ